MRTDAGRRRADILDDLTKPLGSLGQLEEIAAQLFTLRDGVLPHVDEEGSVCLRRRSLASTAEGVSAYLSEEAARQMARRNFLSGGAAVNVLARANGAAVHVVDIGVDADLSGRATSSASAKARRGSRNMLREASDE